MRLRLLGQYFLGLIFIIASNIALSNTELTYAYIGDEIKITGCAGICPADLVIPDIIDGKNVTSIGSSAFRDTGLTSVSIPESVTSISDYAFYSTELTSISLPESIASIGEYAFKYTNITNINIPSSLTAIGRNAFNGMNITSIDIPNTVTSIGSGAFRDTGLTSVSIPESVTSIGSHAFYGTALNTVIFLGDHPNINSNSFGNISNLEAIFYCRGKSGWPGESIEGITPEFSNDILCMNWDIDINGEMDALTDNLLLLRYAFGLRGENLTRGAVSNNSSITNLEVEANIFQAQQILDIDNNGNNDALTDCLLLLRYAFGLRGDDLVSGAISSDANRTSASDIETYIESHMP